MDTAVNRDLFLEKLNALNEQTIVFIFLQKIFSEVVSAKIECNTPLDYRRLKRFDVLKINDKEKLIAPLKPGETNIQYYVTNEELYSILHETHTRIGHGGRIRMLKELQAKYKNITYEVVMLYLNLCKQCQMKYSAPKKGIVVKPMVSSELNSRCQVDLIDLQSNRDGEYKFIMVYQHHLTKFVRQRPLKTKRAEEVVHNVLSIFLTFGAPAILQSDNGREFSNQVISQICAMCKDVEIVHGKPRHSQTQGSVERANQNIQNMLTAWMNDNDRNKYM
ncbi:KRAB-A domain-containing protein 2-like [Diorhabda carinulata]|uniref:KRAB-A domain-containing protein 2-like n=1 Tax=Diorhabda carinulata TaxID=1163345 RepID=UPI0025A0E8C2|nr:KRAB-A domain-containing protein 2-like [Diorhabda carinulata]